jgi:hypothetical protein
MQGVHEPVASASRWQSLGRTVTDWSRRKEVIVPRFAKEPEPEQVEGESLEEKRERVARLIGFTVVRGVLPLSATAGPELPPANIPNWDENALLGTFGIKQVPFDNTNGNLQGWSRGTEFAVNPIAVNPEKTKFHEWAHILLGHTLPHRFEEYQAHRGIMEFQAEATAYVVMNELELLDDETASHMRGYIRHWLGEEQPPDQAIRQVFTVADRILKAGRLATAEG